MYNVGHSLKAIIIRYLQKIQHSHLTQMGITHETASISKAIIQTHRLCDLFASQSEPVRGVLFSMKVIFPFHKSYDGEDDESATQQAPPVPDRNQFHLLNALALPLCTHPPSLAVHSTLCNLL